MDRGQADPGRGGTSARTATRPTHITLAATAAVLAIVLWGGYSHTWRWTGIDGSTATLWDWLHLLALPVAVAALPVWFSRRTRVASRTKTVGTVALGLLGFVVIFGYVVPWAWTGFRGNTLWDWLNLVVLPLAVLAAPWTFELRHRWQRRHTVVAVGIAAVFVALVIGGYAGSWTWTGFTGNTLWNWMNLLLLPLLVPTLIVPALTPVVLRDVVYLDAEGNQVPAPAADPAPAVGPAAAVDPAPAPDPAAPSAPPGRAD